MSRLGWIGLGVAALAGSAVASHILGSTPETPTGGPLDPCGSAPNCARVRTVLECDLEAAKQVAKRALEDVDASDIQETDAGWTAISVIGPFTDDIEVALEGENGETVLWVRSASRVGRSDLGVNARRARHVLEAAQRFAQEASEPSTPRTTDN